MSFIKNSLAVQSLREGEHGLLRPSMMRKRVIYVLIAVILLTQAVYGKPADQETIDLLLAAGDPNVLSAWNALRKLQAEAPELAEFGVEAAVLVTPYLAHPDYGVNAANILKRNPAETVPYLAELINSSEWGDGVKGQAVRVLAEVAAKHSDAVRILDLLLNDETAPYLVRVEALAGLRRLGFEEETANFTYLNDYVQNGRIIVRIDNTSGQAIINGLVTGIVPLPQGMDDLQLRLVDSGGKPIPARFKTLNTWPDGSPRVVEIKALASLEPYQTLIGELILDKGGQMAEESDMSDGQAQNRLELTVLASGLEYLSDIELPYNEGWLDLIVVAKDGTGDFTKVQDAIDAVPENNSERRYIYIRNGVYEEKLVIPNNKPLISLIGESSEHTILTYSDSSSTIGPSGSALGTTGSTSVAARGSDFTVENLTFQNTAGMYAGQAVAIRTTGDRMVFKNVRFLGFQDTLYVTEGRQYFVDCYIYGDVDFIFGNATAVFENCDIVASPKGGYVTAASTNQEAEFGYLFLNCRFTSESGPSKYYLGRPWRPYAHVAVINCYLGDHIRPEGWHNWNDPANEETAQYYEYQNYGPGANTDARVSWAKVLTAEEAAKYTVENVLAGTDGWNPKVRK